MQWASPSSVPSAMLSDKSVLSRKKVFCPEKKTYFCTFVKLYQDSTLHSLIWNLANLGVVLQIALQNHNLVENVNSNFLSYFDRLKILNFKSILIHICIFGGGWGIIFMVGTKGMFMWSEALQMVDFVRKQSNH